LGFIYSDFNINEFGAGSATLISYSDPGLFQTNSPFDWSIVDDQEDQAGDL